MRVRETESQTNVEDVPMNRVERLLALLISLLAFELGVHVGGRQSTGSSVKVDPLLTVAQAQTPLTGASLLPRYIITSNQNGDQIYVWEDEGKGYVAKSYMARPSR